MLPKEPGRYTAIAPALPVSGSLAADLPTIAAFQPHTLQTIFSPFSKDHVDLVDMQRQFEDLKQNTENSEERIYKLEQENCRKDQKNVELQQNIVELRQEIVELRQDNLNRRYQTTAENLRTLNTSIFKRIASFEEEAKGFKAISQCAAEWATLVRQNYLHPVVTL